MIAEWPAVRTTGSEQKTSRLQATASEDVAPGPGRDSFTLQSAAIQVLDAPAMRAGNYFSAGKAGYNANASRALELVTIFMCKIC